MRPCTSKFARPLAPIVVLLAASSCASTTEPKKAAVEPSVDFTSTVSMSTPPSAPAPLAKAPVGPTPTFPERLPGDTDATTAPSPSGAATNVIRETTRDDVAATLDALHDAEAESAKLAVRRATDDNVRAFADARLAEARRVDERRAKRGAEEVDRAPLDTTTSMRLRTETAKSVAALDKQKGRTFDRAFMAFQVAIRRDTLGAIDRELLPNARDPEVDAKLRNARVQIASELDEANTLAEAIAPRP